MYWYKVSAMAIALCVLPACSFVPLYGGGAQITLTIKNKNASAEEQELTKNLRGLFATGDDGADYRLIVDLSLTEQGLAVQPDRTINQKLQRGSVRWQLVDSKGKQRLNQTLFATINFNQTGNYFARLTAAKEAKKKLLQRLALLLQQRIIAFDRKEKENESKTL